MECYALLVDVINQSLTVNDERLKGAGVCSIVTHF